MSLFGWMSAMVLAAGLLTPGWAQEASPKAENRIQSVQVAPGTSVVEIRTEQPVAYRYTAYDSYDPVRVVIDFPGMDVSAVNSPVKTGTGLIQEIRAASFDLTSGKLGRIELILGEEAKYQIVSTDNLFTISFAEPAAAASVPKKMPIPAKAEASKPAAPEAATAKETAAKETTTAARVIEQVQLRNGQAILTADGRIDRVQTIRLGTPPRLVVDVYGVKPAFTERSYPVADGFRQLRVGLYADKTRFVFDGGGETLPEHSVDKENRALIISWTAPKKSAAVAKPAPAAKLAPSVAPAPAVAAEKGASPAAVSIDGVDFKVENGKSVLTVTLSGPAEVIEPTAEGKTVRFGVKNAEISRALRRTIDASSFPSAVRLVTPYLVAERGGVQEVRFAAELKGQVPYTLQREGNRLLFEVENQAFDQPAPVAEIVQVPVPASASIPVAAPVTVKPVSVKQPVAEAVAKQAPVKATPARVTVADAGGRGFSGERISLVFDDANIRNILQLIGEVSSLNIIAGEDVKGTITLRLIDVPWDQALDLILETKNLGMLHDGNVVRILPKDQLRSMRQAELTAVKEERQLESVVTEVIPVSYTALNNITDPAKELLTDRGKITEDARNKQLIVTDIPSVVSDIRKLIAILDTPERQVMIEARIVEANSNFSRDLGVRWGLSYRNEDGGAGDIESINIGGGGSFLLSPPTPGGVGPAGLATGISFGRVLVDSMTLDLRISAMETSGHGKVISTPRITTLNGGKALISQGTKIPYTSVSDSGTETKFESAELKLDVQPVINPDNSVILDIKASNSSVGAVVPQANGGNALSIDEKKAETKVIVRDGETTVIGGIFVEADRTSEVGVPWLARIPILGHLFKSTSKSDERRELLVFITPRILQ